MQVLLYEPLNCREGETAFWRGAICDDAEGDGWDDCTLDVPAGLGRMFGMKLAVKPVAAGETLLGGTRFGPKKNGGDTVQEPARNGGSEAGKPGATSENEFACDDELTKVGAVRT